MPELVDNLANLTTHKNRDDLEVALVSTLKDLLSPLTIAICRSVGERDEERWFTCTWLGTGEHTPKTESAWSDFDQLPRLADHPQRIQALESQQTTSISGSPSITVFPLSKGFETRCVLEIRSEGPMSKSATALVSGVLRLYCNFQNLLDYGERDTLTELLNRKTFDGAFMKATVEQRKASGQEPNDRRESPESGTFWLAMIDIDHFKRVNDTYGHLIGDEVLLLLARLMRSCFRYHDQLYRFGGEEFVVLMRCNAEMDAGHALERLRTSAQNHVFPQVGHITISIGFSEVRVGDTPSSAFERADKAVYYAKEHGRNQVCSHAALIASGDLTEQAVNMGDVELF